jgi:uncharacterized membrane protein
MCNFSKIVMLQWINKRSYFMEYQEQFTTDENNQGELKKLTAVCSYLLCCIIVPIFSNVNNKFVMHHANQGILIWLIYFLSSIIDYIPFLPFTNLISDIIMYLGMACSVYGIINVIKGNKNHIPLIGHINLLKMFKVE